jgi:hypothetical protein
MKHRAIFFFSSLFFLLLSHITSAQIAVLKIDSTLDVPFFHSRQMQLPKWVSRGKKGRLLYASTGKKIRDADTLNLKAPVTSFLMRTQNLLDNVSPDTILSVDSRALLAGDTLVIYCAYQSTLSGEIVGISLSSGLEAHVLDGFAKKENKIDQQAIFKHFTLNKAKYNKGDELRGELDFCIEYNLNDAGRGPYKQKVYYKGWIRCKVE